MATDRPRYTVSVDEELFKEIEDFRFANRYATRSDATVELIRKGLELIARESHGDDFKRVPPEMYKDVKENDA